jgi:hypothetical protein
MDDIGRRAVEEAREVREALARKEEQKTQRDHMDHLEAVMRLAQERNLCWTEDDIQAVSWLMARLRELEGLA